MKFFVLLFIYFIQIQAEICLEDEGCKHVKKKLTFIPLINTVGNETPALESFDYKIIKVFTNSIAFYFSKDNSALFDSSITMSESDLARRVLFSKINLDCGLDGNKLCLGYQYLEIYNKISYKATGIDTISNLEGEFNKQCIIIPIIDATKRSLSDNLIYICEENKDNLREFLKFRDKLSRLIDAYSLTRLRDINSVANSVSLKEDLLKTADSNLNMSSLMVRLNSIKIQGFLSPQNLNTKVFEIILININPIVGVQPVLTAIRNGILSANWSEGFIPKPIDSCCFMIPIRNVQNFTFFCVHYENPNEFSSYDCEKKIEIWIAKINNTAKRNLIGMFGRQIKRSYKTKNFPELDCKKIPELQIFKERIHNFGVFQDEACESLKSFTTTFKYQNCIIDKTDDINSEILTLKTYDVRIENSLDKCLLNGFLDIGKVPINNKATGSNSFLSINVNLLSKNFISGKRNHEKK